MIQKYVDRFNDKERQAGLVAALGRGHPENYAKLVKLVVEAIRDKEEYSDLDPERIHEIDDGDWQGTLVFVIAASGYQPDTYWSVMVGYGSCSGCDTLQAISDYSDSPPTEEQVKDYLTLALHIVQRLKEM